MLKQETVDRALQEIAKGYAQYEHFFDRLNSPAWLDPLSHHGLFKTPPEPKHEGQYITFPFWPESRYLARMAAIPQAQAKVLEIALGIPAAENSRVHDDLADVALALAPELSAKLVAQACEWVRAPYRFLLPHKIGPLIVHLAEGGEGEAALRLARAALALEPDPNGARGNEDSLLRPQPRPRFETFDYERIVASALSPLVKSIGLAAVRLFRDLLDEYIKRSRRRSDEGDEDYLFGHQPAFEASRSPNDMASTLICAVRDAAEQLILTDSEQFSAVIGVLRSKKWSSFTRLELHLSRVFAEDGLSVAEEFFQNPERIDLPALQHEAVLLLQSTFSALTPGTQKRVLSWIDEGPPIDLLRGWHEFFQHPATDDNIRSLADDWRRDHLAILQGQLPDAYQQKLDDLRSALGPGRALEKPATFDYQVFVPRSPKSAEEIAQLGVEEALSFLRTWMPGTDVFSPTAEGLGRNLTTVVTEQPDDFAAVAPKFQDLDPTYVRCFFTGLTEAIKQGKAFAWRPVLDLAEWTVNQPREIPGRTGGPMVADPDWGWTRGAVIDLLDAGFKDKPGNLAYDHRESVWIILLRLTNDPNPSAADESGESFDPFALSINSTRGRAFHTLIRYAWWVRGCIDGESNAEHKEQVTFREMPEVSEVLTTHLNTSREPTLAIRAVYGCCLPSLAALDLDWLQANLTRILPAGSDDPDRFAAAWESFVAYNPPNTALLPLLLPAYQRAVTRLGQPSLVRSPASPEDHLAEHLMVYYWLGKLDFGGQDGLLNSFYAAASDWVRSHAAWFVGRSVGGRDDGAPPEVYARLRKLIELRLGEANAAKSPDNFANELANFGYWFATDKFDEPWALNTLLAVLKLTKKAQSEMEVVKRLVELCPRYPMECVSCLRLMIEGDKDRWLILGVENDAREVLSLAINSSNPNAALSAMRLAEDLIRVRHYGFRSILSAKSP